MKKNNPALLLIGKMVVLFLTVLPHALCLVLGRSLGRMAFSLLKSRAQVAMDNLAMIYGERLTLEQRRAIGRENFGHLGASLMEVLYVVAYPPRLKRITEVEGLPYLEQVLAKGKGVVLFSGHMGNFLLMVPVLRQYYPARFIFRNPSDPTAAAFYAWAMARTGVEVIADNPRHQCAIRSGLYLRRQGIVGALIDQVENGGIYVDFMGKPAASTLGAAQLALKTGAPLMPIHCIRTPAKKLKIILGPEFPVQREGAEAECLNQAVAAMNQEVSKWVWQNPEQWFWGHRRWRTWRK